MNLQELQANNLRENKKTEISHNFHYITIFENDNNEFTGEVYDGEEFIFSISEPEAITKDICHAENELIAINFFTQISSNLTAQGL